MTRRSLLARLPVAFAERRSLDDQRDKAIAFDLHWNLYIRRLFGCPDAGELSTDTCHVPTGTTDYREFSKAREAAKKLFDLKD